MDSFFFKHTKQLLYDRIRSTLLSILRTSRLIQSKNDFQTGHSSLLLDEYINVVAEQPLDPKLHYQLADIYAQHQHWFSAIAEYRTSITLGNNDARALLSLAMAYIETGLVDLAVSTCESILKKSKETLMKDTKKVLAEAKRVKPWPLTNFNHNRYYRMKTLADHLLNLFPSSNFSVLDVGGGDGALALFIPKADYVLAEPSTNGISGSDLPFGEKSFDAIVACHVLEHIPQAERVQFLDQLCSRAKKCVLLLNPFFDPDGYVDERLHLVVELTNAEWAKEHLNCALPKLDEVKQFAVKRGFGCQIWPNGSLTTTMAFVFLDHYVPLGGRRNDLSKINQFYNTRLFEKLVNTELPAAYLIELELNQ